MTYCPDPRVDAYLDALPPWQREICRQVREIVRAADHVVVETIKRTVQPYFVLAGNVCARTIAIYEDDPIDTTALHAMFVQIIANNRAGGWRKIKHG